MANLKCSKIAQKPYKCLDSLDLVRTTCLRKIDNECLIRFLLLFDNVYPIIRKICSYLPYMELLAIQGLSDSWRTAAIIEISKRNNLSWMLLYQYPMTTKVFTSEGFDYAQKVLGFFFSSGEFPQVQVSDTKNIKRQNLYQHVRDDILGKTVTNLLCVLVPSTRLILPFSLDPGGGKSIGTFLFLPEIPSINIKYFLYHAEASKQENIFEKIIKDSNEIECLFVFGLETQSIKEMMLKLNRNRSQFHCCGCKVPNLILSSETTTCCPNEMLFCVAFVSNGLNCNNFTSASVNVIYTHEAEVVQGILEFKRKIVLLKHCVMFQLINSQKYVEFDVEDILSQHFTDIPVLQLGVYDIVDENGDDVYAFSDNKMRFLTCLCCRRKEIVLDNSSTQGVPNQVVMQQPKKPVDRTVSVSSNTLSMKSFYSVRSLASGADDFQSICSADSFQSVRP